MTIKWKEQVPGSLSEADAITEVVLMYEIGISSSSLGILYNVHATSIRNLLKKHNVPRRSCGGPNNTKYTELNIPKEEFQSNSYRKLAKKYQVSTSTINNYRKRKGWSKGGLKHVSV